MKKYANRERGLRLYAQGNTIENNYWWLQDGSWAAWAGCRIYFKDVDHENDVCLSLNKKQAQKLIKGLQKFIELN